MFKGKELGQSQAGFVYSSNGRCARRGSSRRFTTIEFSVVVGEVFVTRTECSSGEPETFSICLCLLQRLIEMDCWTQIAID